MGFEAGTGGGGEGVRELARLQGVHMQLIYKYLFVWRKYGIRERERLNIKAS